MIMIEADNLDAALAVARELQDDEDRRRDRGPAGARMAVPWRLTPSSASTGGECSRRSSGSSVTSSWPRTPPKRRSRSPPSAGRETANPTIPSAG